MQETSDCTCAIPKFIQSTELYIANAGRFNVEANIGWNALEQLIAKHRDTVLPLLSHSQVQALLGSIGNKKGYDVWIPANDRIRLDWIYAEKCEIRQTMFGIDSIRGILEEIDVIWLKRGASEINALFEVEHTTPIYSGLLRFNDIRLAFPNFNPRFTIVANEERRSLFARQASRPTFQLSGIGKMCTFLEYRDVFGWFQRLACETP